jgi:hypothetical protein
MNAVEFYGYEAPETQESWLEVAAVGIGVLAVMGSVLFAFAKLIAIVFLKHKAVL